MIESYEERMNRELKEIKMSNPDIIELINKIKIIFGMGNHEFDHDIEKDYIIYTTILSFMENRDLID